MTEIKILICDDFKQIREFFQDLLDRQEDMEVVGVASNGSEAVALAALKKPDVVLMDIQMETEKAGIEATQKIVERLPGVKIIMLTVHQDDDSIFDAYAAGAVDYILKTMEDDVILDSIRQVVRENDYFIRPMIAERFIKEVSDTRRQHASLMYMIGMVCSLSNTQLEILKDLCNGMTRREIAAKRVVELVTVNTQIGRILQKLGYKKTKDLIDALKKLHILDLFQKN